MLSILLTFGLYFTPLTGEERQQIIQGFASESFTERQNWSSYAAIRLTFYTDESSILFFKSIAYSHDNAEVKYRCRQLEPLLWGWRPKYSPFANHSKIPLAVWNRTLERCTGDYSNLCFILAEELLIAGFSRAEIKDILYLR